MNKAIIIIRKAQILINYIGLLKLIVSLILLEVPFDKHKLFIKIEANEKRHSSFI